MRFIKLTWPRPPRPESAVSQRVSRNLRKGHPKGGPPHIVLLLAALLVALLGACSAATGPDRPSPEGRTPSRPLDVYRDLGMLAGGMDFPGVVTLSTLAGPADSTYLLIGLSLPNSALRFHRDGDGYRADYGVNVTLLRDEEEVRSEQRQGVVRVATFDETVREDESVLFQLLTTLEPGDYTLEFRAQDAAGTRGFEESDSIRIPAYGAQGDLLSAPLAVFKAEKRSGRQEEPKLLLNVRSTIPYGRDSVLVYLEGYDMPVDEPVVLHVVDRVGEMIWQSEVNLESRAEGFSSALIAVPGSDLPLGTLWFELDVGTEPRVTATKPLLVTISDQWIVANFEDLLRVLRYVATSAELDALAEATGAERRDLWEEFWERRARESVGTGSELRDRFFQRVRTATHEFAEPGRDGWDTERGEVFILLGRPDHMVERMDQRGGLASTIEWVYERTLVGRLVLTFVDPDNIGRYELTMASRNRFQSLVTRMHPR